MTTPQVIEDLVARYRREIETLQSALYGEADTRKEFIEPLFTALGWDVANVAQNAEAYKDVVNEYSLKIGQTHKAPDYAFRIGGHRSFFVEAKKPSVDIARDMSSAYQLRRYGWTANLPVSILTNFRTIAVYDCGRAPKETDAASVARTLVIRWDELIGRWDELTQLLSKTSVYQGSLDRYASASSRRRGTSLVDDEFLKQMEIWRRNLASNIALRNRSLDVTELNEVVQQTIDRIVFLRIAEDRGIETYGTLKDVVNGSGVYARLLGIFRAADLRYNSGLFHFRDEKNQFSPPDQLTPRLIIDDRTLRDVIEAMYYPASPYEFSVLPADILGQVYEQFLGKVIRLTPAHQAVIEDKPEVKKAGGVFYTPSWVVNHIVDETLGKALDGLTPNAALKLKIIDPACGSGSFLIGAYEGLLRWFASAYEAAAEKSRASAMFMDSSGEWRLTLAKRKEILTSCIYGVDIDRQAVEVTKLSLMLKVLEGQNLESISNQLRIFHLERVLPDLDRNIQCGNSLVASDISHFLTVERIDEEQLNPADWEVMFPEIINNGGFDVVIGNPPYDVLEKDRGAASWPHALLRDYLPFRDDLSPALGGKLNLYRLFLVQSIGLTRPKGLFGMIVPLSLAADISTAKTRRFVLTSLAEPVLDCFPQKDNANRRVFLKAKLSTLIISGRRSVKSRGDETMIRTKVYPGNSLLDSPVENEVRIADCDLLDPNARPVPLTGSVEWALCCRIHRSEGVRRLGSLTDSYIVTRGEINQTTYRTFIGPSDKDRTDLLKGVEIGSFVRHSVLSQGQREWFDEDQFFHKYPSKRAPANRRIATQRISGVDERQRVVATIIDGGAWFADSTNSIEPTDGAILSLEYLLGLLNSDLMQWRFKITSTNNNVGTNELDALPILVPDLSTEGGVKIFEDVCSSAMRITQVKAGGPPKSTASSSLQYERRLSAAFAHLNDVVYSAYQLSTDERALVADRLKNQTRSSTGESDEETSRLALTDT